MKRVLGKEQFRIISVLIILTLSLTLASAQINDWIMTQEEARFLFSGNGNSPLLSPPVQKCANLYSDIEILNDQKDTLVQQSANSYDAITKTISDAGCNVESLRAEVKDLRSDIKTAKSVAQKTRAKNKLEQFKKANNKCLKLTSKLGDIETKNQKTQEKVDGIAANIVKKESSYSKECSQLTKEDLQKYCKGWKEKSSTLEKQLAKFGYSKNEIATLKKLRDIDKAAVTNEQQLAEINAKLENPTDAELEKIFNDLEKQFLRVRAKIATICASGGSPNSNPQTIITNQITEFRIENYNYKFKADYLFTEFTIDGKSVKIEERVVGGAAQSAFYTIACKEGNKLKAVSVNTALNERHEASYDISAYKCAVADPTATPSCIDGLKNQDETSVDCGGTTCGPCEIKLYCGDNECSLMTENAQTCPQDCGLAEIRMVEGQRIKREISGTHNIEVLGIKDDNKAIIKIDGEEKTVVKGKTYIVGGLAVVVNDIYFTSKSDKESYMIITMKTTSVQQPEPSCTDGIKNGDEEGTDCGGTCNACKASSGEASSNGEKIQIKYQFSCQELKDWWTNNKAGYKIRFGEGNFDCPGDKDNNGNLKPISKEAKMAAAFLLFEQLDVPQVTKHIPGQIKFTQFIKNNVPEGFHTANNCDNEGAYYRAGGVYLCSEWFEPKTHSGGQDLGKDIFPYTTLVHEIGHAYVKQSYSGNGHVECKNGNRKGHKECDPALRNQPFAKNGGGVNFEFWFNAILQKYFVFPNKPDADSKSNSERITSGYLNELFNTKLGTDTDYYLNLLK
jgi:hypothetical protein